MARSIPRLLAWVTASYLVAANFTFSFAPLAAQEFQDLVKQHCSECHNATEKSGGLDLDALSWQPSSMENRAKWITIHDRVRSGEMPPESKLSEAERGTIAGPVAARLIQEIAAEQKREGRTVLRRLNRREFENSVHDLLGVNVPLQHLLPEDGRAQGFDTVAEGLRISAVQIEKYLEAIDIALEDAIRLTEQPTKFNKRMRFQDEKEVRENLDTAETHVDPVSGARHRRLFRETDDAVVFISHGYSPDNLRQFAPPANGLYRVRVRAYSVDSRDGPIAMRVLKSDWKNHHLLHYFNLTDDPREVEFTVPMNVNEHLRFSGYGIGIDADGKSVWNVDSTKDWKVPGMAIEWIEVEGPLLEQWPPASMPKMFGAENVRKLEKRGRWTNQGHLQYELAADDPKAASSESLHRFAERAFRRPLELEETKSYVDLVHSELDRGRSFEQAMRVGLRSILVSPRFLLLDESPGPLDDYALASRLSYFFWSSMPDELLLQLAKAGKLSQKENMHSEVERLLASPRAQQFVSSFVGQWLDVNQIDATTPDAKLYPEYDDILRESMIAETQHYFTELLTSNLPIAHFIDSDFAMLDRRLADHYRLQESFASSREGKFDEEFRRVTLPNDSPRGGVMTQAAILKVTANGTVSSPVLRGAWIQRRIVGKPPANPPPVNAIEPDTRGATTIREQLAKHRDSETCNRCHREIDPPGFALECFDVIGGFRERYRSVGKGDQPTEKLHGRSIWEYKLGQKVDCSGETSDGKPFTDIREFKRLMLAEKDQIVRNLASRLVTYSTGAGVSFADRAAIEQIVSNVRSQGDGLRTMIHEVVASELFRSK